MLQERLRTSLDDRIVGSQFGQRRGKSAPKPIFIARRAQEIAERHSKPFYMLALDYSKALDSIPQKTNRKPRQMWNLKDRERGNRALVIVL